MNYHIDDWRAQQRTQSDRTQSPWEVRQRRRCIILQPWLRGRPHATNTLPHTTVFVSTHNPASRLLQPRINVGMMLDSRCVRQQEIVVTERFETCTKFMRDCDNSAVIVNTVPMQSARQRWDCTSLLRHSIFNMAMQHEVDWTGSALRPASYENRQWTGLLHSVAREAMLEKRCNLAQPCRSIQK